MTSNQSLKKLRLFAASPSDVSNERGRLATVVEELRSLAEHVGVTLELVDWRKVVPDIGRPEQVILDQLQPTTWDVFIGILWHRFGTPTKNVDPQTGKEYFSGTEEEFRLAYSLWKKQKRPYMMFFWCKRSIPPDDLDPDQYKRVKDFFVGFAPDADHPGLYQTFDASESFERLIRQNLIDFLLDYAQKEKGQKISVQEVQSLAPHLPDTLPRRQPFFGRNEEITQALRALSPEDRGWGVVIDGIGGMGKTALAIEVAHICKNRGLFDAFIFVTAKRDRLEPAGIQNIKLTAQSLDELLNEVARSLAHLDIAHLHWGEQKQRALLEMLRGNRVLIIFDNLETLTLGEQTAIGDFLRYLPEGCKAITTSRRRTGESAVIIRLEKLKWEEARQLIEDQITRDSNIHRAFARVGETGWKSLYDESDGLPLALLWTIGLIHARGLSFERALAILRDGSPESDLISFMYREARKKMDVNEKTTLGALSLFSGPAAFDALAATSNLDRNALNSALQRLHALSLVDLVVGGESMMQLSSTQDPTLEQIRALIIVDITKDVSEYEPIEEKYSLHQLTKRFACTDLATDPEIEHIMGMRFAHYWLDYSKRYGGKNQKSFTRLNIEWINIKAAIDWLWEAVMVQRFEISNKDTAQMLIDFVCTLWQFLWFNGRWDDYTKLNSRAYESALVLHDWSKATLHAYLLAWIHNCHDNSEEVDLWVKRCLEACENSQNKHDRAIAKRLSGLIAKGKRQYEQAEQLLTDALNSWQEIDNNDWIANVFNNLGGLELERGNHSAAEQYFQQALTLASKIDDKEGQAVYKSNLGELALERKHYTSAQKHFEEALLLAQLVGRQDLIADTQYGLALVLLARRQRETAKFAAEKALDIYEQLQHPNLNEVRELLKKII